MSFRTCYQLLILTKDINLSKNLLKKYDTFIIYSDRDLGFIKKQSIDLKKIGIKTISVLNDGHRHFFFNVEKSADSFSSPYG